MKKISLSVFLLCLFLSIFLNNLYAANKDGSFKNSRRMHTAYFENTDYELHVYKIFGEKKGNTIMILGGIQGDEPGGFLTADTYADISLAKGAIIVVPRANLPSILLQKRSVNVDMNRKFADEDAKDYEGKIVKILKELIFESDCLLNLHDGSGFFSPVWISDMKNPLRYGQSVIADFKKYKTKDGKELNLEETARRVVVEANKKILNKDLHFSFNNHRTSEQDSLHKEQRKSATYYAVTKCNIPAFGIETSKSLSVIKKVKHHQYVINAFFDEYNVIPELPPLVLEKPQLKYVVISVNNNTPMVLKKGETLYVSKNDLIRVLHVEANYDRGLTIDFIDKGRKNDMRSSIKVDKDLRIVARKDYEPCGSVYIKVANTLKEENVHMVAKQPKGDYFFFKTRINNKEIRLIENRGSLRLKKGEVFEIIDIVTGLFDPSELEVNIKGYVNNRANNTGEDRGFVVDTKKDFWVKYSLNKKGRSYPVIVSRAGTKIGKMTIDLEPEPEKFLIFKSETDEYIALKNGADLSVENRLKYRLYSVSGISNEDFLKGRFALVCDGKKIIPGKEGGIIENIYNPEKGRTKLKLISLYKGMEKTQAKFNLVK